MISDPQASDTDDSRHTSKEGYRSLGDAVKVYESTDTKRRLAPGQPILVRLDGRAFHTLTKQVCTRPFDIGFRNLMADRLRAAWAGGTDTVFELVNAWNDIECFADKIDLQDFGMRSSDDSDKIDCPV